MASTFKNLGLFDSGPHRFAVLKQGQLVVPELSQGIPDSGSLYLGPLELKIVVTGRLVAASETALWALRDAITAQLLHPPTPGTLIDHYGRTWTDMSFSAFEPADRTDRGRTWSLAYTATFIDFKTYPQ